MILFYNIFIIYLIEQRLNFRELINSNNRVLIGSDLNWLYKGEFVKVDKYDLHYYLNIRISYSSSTRS